MAGIYYKVSLRNQQANQEDNPIAILEDKKYSSSKSDSKRFLKDIGYDQGAGNNDYGQSGQL